MKQSSASSPQEKHRLVRVAHTDEISDSVRAELEALAKMPDDEIDFSDIPEQLDWSDSIPNRFYRPVKKPVTLRLDSDVLAWCKAKGPGYQTRINATLRRAMLEDVQA